MIRYLTTAEVAAILGVSTRYVLRQVEAGTLRSTALQTGSRPTLRYRPEDVRAWLARYATVRNGDAGPIDT